MSLNVMFFSDLKQRKLWFMAMTFQKHWLLPQLWPYQSFQVTDMMVANSHNLIVTVKPANQRNNVVHRGSKTTMGNSGSVGSAGSTSSAVSHDSPSPASQSNPITARYDMDRTERLAFALKLLIQKILHVTVLAVYSSVSLAILTSYALYMFVNNLFEELILQDCWDIAESDRYLRTSQLSVCVRERQTLS